ncbi:MAG TPA: S8 family peptidase [Gaiellaceae bacterium]|nr:S8 family peptidase [Gaiellaceae bacterium]
MRRPRRFLRIALLPALAAGLLAATVAGSASGKPIDPSGRAPLRPSVPGELLIGFRPGVTPAAQADLLSRAGARRERRFERLGSALVSVEPGRATQALRSLKRDRRIAYAEPNYVVYADDHGTFPNDPSMHQLWGLDNFGQTVNGVAGTPDADIDAEEAWAVSTGSPNVVVAVIDTGVDTSHPDLAANAWVNPGEDCAGCRTNGIDDDGNGYVDDWRGWDFVNGDNNPADDHGHGTHVAGTIAGVGNNGLGVAGVTWSTKIMPLKFLSASGTGTVADAISAILYANAKGVPILNNSWGGDDFSQALLDAIEATDASGGLFVAAAGNSFTNTDVSPNYPSGYEAPNVLSVGATEAFDRKAWFSNYGAASVDLSAPGANILSTWPGGTYRFQDGTSMAAPQVAGAAALVKAAQPGASGAGLKALLLRSVDTVAALTGTSRTGGRLNVDHAARCSGEPKAWIDSPAQGFEADAGEPLAIRVLAGNCSDPAGVTVAATVNGSPLELGARGDGLYTASLVPATGPIAISVTASANGLTDTQAVSGMAIQNYAITAGGPPVTIATTWAGENARLHFDGAAGQRVSLRMSDVTIGTSTCCSARISIAKPDGTSLVTPTPVGRNGGFLDTRTLPATGAYTILVDPQGTDVGSMTLTLYDVRPDAVGSITAGGPPVSTTTDVPGQNALVRFSGSAGQRVSLRLSDVTIGTSTCCSTRVSITKPDGSTLVFPTPVGTSGGFIDTRSLPVAGLYTILVDPQGADVGSMTLTLYDVPPDVSASISPGGAPVTVSMGPVPGQNALVRFSGVAGRRVALAMTNVTIGTSTCCSARVSIAKPDGTSLVPATPIGRNGGFLDTRTLPATGDYTILVDPQGTDLGSMTVTLYDVPADLDASIVIGGAPLSLTLGPVPGQNATVRFTGTAGQRITLRLTNVTIGTSTCCGARIATAKPDGSSLVPPILVGTNGGTITATLPVAGSYSITVDPQGANTGGITLTLTSP